jgi:predicted  nucleic acid-binding Zn-ribbon protein
MSELKQMESQLSQLIGMAAKIKETTDKTSKDLTDLRQEFNIEKELNKARFEETLKEVRNSKFEMEHLRNKTANWKAICTRLNKPFTSIK